MNNFTFENQGTTTYLVYQIHAEDNIDTLSMGMLTNNKIPGLAGTSYTQVDETRYIKYNVSSKVSISQLFAGPVNKKRLLGAFRGIVEAMLSAEEYMIEFNSILLDHDYIFADVSSCETILVCLPLVKAEPMPELGMFFKNIMFSTQFDQTENCDHVAKIINYLNSTPSFSLENFNELLKTLDESKKSAGANISNSSPANQPQKKAQPVVSSTSGNAAVLSQTAMPQQPMQPTVQPAERKEAVPGAEEQNDDPKMSFMYLMRHYSKENAEIYKKQKDSAKSSDTKPQNKKEKNKDKKKSPEQVQTNFAVPGMPTQPDFNMPVKEPEVKQEPAQPAKTQSQQPVVSKPVYQPQQSAQPVVGGNANFGNTTVLNAGMKKGETTVLNATNASTVQQAFMIRTKNNEKIMINKPVYRIGKERSYVDYFVGDNSAVSRSHANIITRDGEYYIVDTNSTNHTYLNGEMLQSNMEVRLSNGSRIRLANEEFEFKLY